MKTDTEEFFESIVEWARIPVGLCRETDTLVPRSEAEKAVTPADLDQMSENTPHLVDILYLRQESSPGTVG